MKNIELYKYFSEKIKKYNSENEEKIGIEKHSNFEFYYSQRSIRVDIYASLEEDVLENIFKNMNLDFELKIFKKYPKKKRTYVLTIFWFNF